MLGLGSSINSEEGYAKGERYRERYHDTTGTYNLTANPLGKFGVENDYVGGFSRASDDDNYEATNATLTIDSATLQVVADDTGGSAKIGVATIPFVSYTLTFDIAVVSVGNTGQVKVGVTSDDDLYVDSGTLSAGTDQTITFTPLLSYTQILFISNVNTKLVKYDNISLKES